MQAVAANQLIYSPHIPEDLAYVSEGLDAQARSDSTDRLALRQAQEWVSIRTSEE